MTTTNDARPAAPEATPRPLFRCSCGEYTANRKVWIEINPCPSCGKRKYWCGSFVWPVPEGHADYERAQAWRAMHAPMPAAPEGLREALDELDERLAAVCDRRMPAESAEGACEAREIFQEWRAALAAQEGAEPESNPDYKLPRRKWPEGADPPIVERLAERSARRAEPSGERREQITQLLIIAARLRGGTGLQQHKDADTLDSIAAALASPASAPEPAAWRIRGEGKRWLTELHHEPEFYADDARFEITPLYAHPPAPEGEREWRVIWDWVNEPPHHADKGWDPGARYYRVEVAQAARDDYAADENKANVRIQYHDCGTWQDAPEGSESDG